MESILGRQRCLHFVCTVEERTDVSLVEGKITTVSVNDKIKRKSEILTCSILAIN